ncbi:MAG: hypothetical protein H0Z53_00795 [Nitrosospira sp.]|nr:hypothetical protein [Nitrosospira sp.]
MPAITLLPTPAPSRTMIDAVYVPAADALMGALPQLVAEINVAVTAMNNNSTNATSTTALSIGAGTKSLTVQTSKSYVVGQSLKIASSASPSNYMIGYVTAYTAETGALVVTVTQHSGSGTIAAWTVTLAVEGVLSRVVLNGATSGSITIEAPAVAGSGTLTLPVATDTLVGKDTADTLTNKTLVAPVLGTPVSGELTNCTGTVNSLNAGIGVNQTWTNVLTTPGRSAGTTYTNSTGKPIFVLITCSSGTTTITGTVNGLTFTSGIGSGAYYNASTIYLIVPNGNTYKTNSFGAGIQSWFELR